jgi:hypothetical protein
MGFLDKAKKLAEQAQTKLDEVQQQVNQQGPPTAGAGGPVTHYDQHGRPIPPEKTSTPPHGDPLRPEGDAPAAPPSPPTPDPSAPPHGDPIAATPGVPPTDPSPPVEGQGKPPAMPGAPPSRDDEDPYAPPKLTGGDPLA